MTNLRREEKKQQIIFYRNNRMENLKLTIKGKLMKYKNLSLLSIERTNEYYMEVYDMITSDKVDRNDIEDIKYTLRIANDLHEDPDKSRWTIKIEHDRNGWHYWYNFKYKSNNVFAENEHELVGKLDDEFFDMQFKWPETIFNPE